MRLAAARHLQCQIVQCYQHCEVCDVGRDAQDRAHPQKIFCDDIYSVGSGVLARERAVLCQLPDLTLRWRVPGITQKLLKRSK